MSQTWVTALKGYRYPANLRTFEFKEESRFSGYFQNDLNVGNRDQTIDFENHFRSHAAQNTAVWVEVVYWKLHSQPQIRNGTTRRVADRLKEITPLELLRVCKAYVESPSRARFEALKSRFVGSRAIAVAATFPAFLDPERFPMVDTRIAKWVGQFAEEHNIADQAVILIRPPFLDNAVTVLTMSDYDFMESWTKWCRYLAGKLTIRTSMSWRARDVEMAVFTAADNKKQLKLNPLPPI